METDQPAEPLGKHEFRRIMGHFATGVTLVTSRRGDEVHALTVNAFCSLSLEPLLVLVCIADQADSHRFLSQSGVLAVNFLSREQQHLSELFARPADEKAGKLEQVPHRSGATGSPIIEGCLAYLDCRIVATHEGGDHTIFVGQVVEAGLTDDASPLIFYRGRYTTVAPPKH